MILSILVYFSYDKALGGFQFIDYFDSWIPFEAFTEASRDDIPTCFICYTIKGFGLPLAGHKDNHAGLMNTDQFEEYQKFMKYGTGIYREFTSYEDYLIKSQSLEPLVILGEPFLRVEQMPLFGDCKDEGCTNIAVMKFVMKNFRYPEISQYCENVASVIKPLGPFNFQIRMHEKKPYIFEINPRCSSTTVMRAVLGFNEPEMAILDLVLQQKIEMPNIQYRNVFRYWEEAYIEQIEKDSTYDNNGKFNLPNAITLPFSI